MYTMHMKHWKHEFHFPSARAMGAAFGRTVRSSYFWLALAVAAVIVGMLWLMIVAFLRGDLAGTETFYYGQDMFLYP